MGKKADRIWAQRSEAVAFLAEFPTMTAAEGFARLFHSTADTLVKESGALKVGIIARKRAEIARLQAETALDGAAFGVPQATVDALQAERAAAVDARLALTDDELQEIADMNEADDETEAA